MHSVSNTGLQDATVIGSANAINLKAVSSPYLNIFNLNESSHGGRHSTPMHSTHFSSQPRQLIFRETEFTVCCSSQEGKRTILIL